MKLTNAQRERVYGKTEPKYKVGDWVAIRQRPTFGPALVIRHRGPLGTDGEHVYRLRQTYEWGDAREFEQVESSLNRSEPPTASV